MKFQPLTGAQVRATIEHHGEKRGLQFTTALEDLASEIGLARSALFKAVNDGTPTQRLGAATRALIARAKSYGITD